MGRWPSLAPTKNNLTPRNATSAICKYQDFKILVVLTGNRKFLPGGGNDGGIESSIARHGHSDGNDPANGP